MKSNLELIIIVATIIGGIAGLGYFLDKFRSRRRARHSFGKYDVLRLTVPRLNHVSYFPVYPSIDIKDAINPGMSIHVKTDIGSFKFAPPDHETTIREILASKHDLSFDSMEYAKKKQMYRSRFELGNFAIVDQYNMPDLPTPDYFVFSNIIKEQNELARAKKSALEDYLENNNGFHFNKDKLAVFSMTNARDHQENIHISFELFHTDYYSYQVLKYLAGIIRGRCRLNDYLSKGILEYMANGIQKNIHLGIGLNIVVHTLQDDRIVITRRSSQISNTAQEAGRYSISANEGISKIDIDPNNPHCLRPMLDVVKRALGEELIGRQESGPDLLTMIERCYLTGVFLYLPNLSIGLSCYVAIDCTSDDIRAARSYARDGVFETSEIISEAEWDKKTGLPKFSNKCIYEFIENTTTKRGPQGLWNEASLITLALSSLVAPK